MHIYTLPVMISLQNSKKSTKVPNVDFRSSSPIILHDCKKLEARNFNSIQRGCFIPMIAYKYLFSYENSLADIRCITMAPLRDSRQC